MGTLNFRNPLNFGSSSAIIAEGLEDWNEIKAARAIARDPVTADERQQKRRIRAAKSWAAAYDIAYWPAFAYGDKSPSRDAMVAAEAALSPKHGHYGDILPDGSRGRGGFDSYGCHGLSGSDVRSLWFIAGCKDSSKFRFMVRNWVRDMPEFRKGDSLAFCINYQRGFRWWHSNARGIVAKNGGTEYHHAPIPSRKALAALGRISPTLRWAAIEGIGCWNPGDKPVRVRDLNWDAVKRSQILLATGGERVQLALMTPRGALMRLTGCNKRLADWRQSDHATVVLTLTPQYAGVENEIPFSDLKAQDAQAIVLGNKTIGQLVAGGQFNDKIAHEWVANQLGTGRRYDNNHLGWYADRVGVPQHRSIRVMDWMSYLKKKGWWGEMEKTRTQIIGGEERQFRAIDLLDEIQEEDILTGKEGVAVALRRASERNGEAFFQANKEDYRTLRHGLPTWVKKAPKWIKVLNTRSALALEGRDLKHCVGGYVDAVERGRSIILSISSRHGRSTVECNDNMVVMQHRGESNGVPPSRHDQLLRAFFNKMR